MSATRQPFAEVSSQRLQHLTSLKNRQNGLFSTPTANTKSPLSIMTKASPSPVSTTKKRARDSSPASSIYEDNDSENVDPGLYLSPSKKTKGIDGINKPSSITFTKAVPAGASLLRQTFATTPRANVSALRTPSTAPAGRSPPRRKISPRRRISAPYTRIDPPVSSRYASSDPMAHFFSLEEAIAGSLRKSAPVVAKPRAPVEETIPGVPKSWFFSIHEDTPDQEAENLMEHSTKVLDIGSDEESVKSANDKGKENVAPPDFVAPVAAAVQAGGQGTRARRQRRRKVVKKDEVDDGLRNPLGEVEREDFFAEGLKGDEIVVVDGEGPKVDVRVPKVAKVEAVPPVVPSVKDEMTDIVIFED